MSPTFVSDKVAFIRYKGLFDYEGLLKLVRDWMLKKEFKFEEPVLKHKMPEVELEWKASKKRTEYVKETVVFKAHFWNLKPVETVKDGKTKKLYTGRGEMTFLYSVDTDWANAWKGKPFMQKLRDFYERYIIRNKLLFQHVGPLEGSVQELVTKVKKHLGMEGA